MGKKPREAGNLWKDKKERSNRNKGEKIKMKIRRT